MQGMGISTMILYQKWHSYGQNLLVVLGLRVGVIKNFPGFVYPGTSLWKANHSTAAFHDYIRVYRDAWSV